MDVLESAWAQRKFRLNDLLPAMQKWKLSRMEEFSIWFFGLNQRDFGIMKCFRWSSALDLSGYASTLRISMNSSRTWTRLKVCQWTFARWPFKRIFLCVAWKLSEFRAHRCWFLRLICKILAVEANQKQFRCFRETFFTVPKIHSPNNAQ